MASQIYSRYVPPPKNNAPTASQTQQPTARAPSPPPSKPTPPPTQNDASSTYARYIPYSKPKSKPVLQQIEVKTNAQSPPPTPKRKRKHGEFVETNQEPSSKKAKKKKHEKAPKVTAETPGVAQHVEAKVAGPKQKKLKHMSEHVETHDADDDDVEVVKDEDDPRHKKLMKKRERSLRKAAKLAKQDIKEPGTDEQAEPIIEEPPELHDLIPLPQPEPVPEPPIQSSTASLPPWLSSPIRISPTATATFSEVGVAKDIAKALQMKGFKQAFAVQAAVLPLLLPCKFQKEGDVLVSAATGSGKTLAYVLPMVEAISHNQITKLRGLIVLPTRELVSQVREVSETCASIFGVGTRKRLRIGTAVGNDTFKAEQAALMEQELRYNPEGYRKQIDRLNAKWESSDLGSDEELCNEELVSSLPDHVINPISKVDILICTPGRLVDHLKSTTGFTLENIKWLVVDEADKLLDQSFQQWLDVVMVGLRGSGRDTRKVILSATMTRDIGHLNNLKLHRPKLVVLDCSGDVTKDAPQSLFLPSLLVESGIKVEAENIKPLYLLEILKRENLIPSARPLSQSTNSSALEEDSDGSSDSSRNKMTMESSSDTPNVEPEISDTPRGVLIFTKSNEAAVRLGRLIALLEPNSAGFIGTLTSTIRSSARRVALKSFESGKLSILVASDLVSRGLDLPNLAHVVNYDVPTSLTGYVHRVGRTARAGKKGHAWTLFTATEARWFWNEIGRSERVKRDGKVERVNMKANIFDGSMETYESSLQDLGREASLVKHSLR